MIKLTACMIVKNEEANLRRCLSIMAHEGFIDQLVVVDTGSTDNSVDIARSFGAEVYFHPWRDDFSWARNKSLEYAKGQWILIIDADEEMIGTTNDLMNFKRYLMFSKYDAVTLHLENIKDGRVISKSSNPRVFRNEKVHYEEIVHNKPIVESGLPAYRYGEIIMLRHYGYDLSPEKMEEKKRRTLGLLKKRIEIDDEDYDAYFYLAQTYGFFGDIPNAIRMGEKYVDARPKISRFNQKIYVLLIEAYTKTKRFNQAMEMIKEGASEYPYDIDIAYTYMQFSQVIASATYIYDSAEKYIFCYEKFDTEDAIKERGTRFVFHYSEEKYILALSLAAANFIHKGLSRLNDLKAKVGENKEYEGLLRSVNDALLNIVNSMDKPTK